MLPPTRLSPTSSSGADGSAAMSSVPPPGTVSVIAPGFTVTSVCCTPLGRVKSPL